MRILKKGLAMFLVVLLLIPSTPVFATAANTTTTVFAEEEVNTVLSSEEGENQIEEEIITESMEKKDDAIEEEMIELSTEESTIELIEEEITTESVDEINTVSEERTVFDEAIYFNTGKYDMKVADRVIFERGESDAEFNQDGSYTIQIPENNPFFPYEVQFTYNGEVTREWFMTPKDSVTIGNHTFYVSAYFDNSTITQMNLNVAGKIVTVYPEEKEFSNSGGISTFSMLPLEEKRLRVDLSGFTPVELTMVSVDSIFKGNEQLKETDTIIWKSQYSNEEYRINSSGSQLNLSVDTCYSNYSSWEMIVGVNDQLASSNIRYIVNLEITSSEEWLNPTVYTQDSTGNRKPLTVKDFGYYDYSMNNRRQEIQVSSTEMGSSREAYISFSLDSSFPNLMVDQIKVFEGYATSASELSGKKEITAQIMSTDMTQKGAGYPVFLYNNKEITIVTYNADGSITGCLPLYLYFTSFNNASNISVFMSDYDVCSSFYSRIQDGVKYQTFELYKEYAANQNYGIRMNCYDENGAIHNEKVTAAYVGDFTSIAQAVGNGAVDIKDKLFGSTGYETDYSKGVYISVFIGDDVNSSQEIYRYCIKTETGLDTLNKLNSDAEVTFIGFDTKDLHTIEAYQVSSNEDSYAEYNYLTVLVGRDVDLSQLAPNFITNKNTRLYATGSNTPIESGKEFFDFSKGPVQFTTSSEDGIHSKNYWVQVVGVSDKNNILYINSFKDDRANTKTENEVVYSDREILLDNYHDTYHDIIIANMGSNSIGQLSVELNSKVLELDNYWTLHGKHELSVLQNVGQPENLAKVRLKAKKGTKEEVITGTLTIRSGSTILAILNLTGIIGAPIIVTEEIPQAVKYVPYGTMIQNNNSYSWNQTTYSLISGKLPDGMIIKPNGELYGVPKEYGEFTFTVKLDNSARELEDSSKTFSMIVVDNTDTNVENATDTGYTLTERIENVDENSTGTQLLVSEGKFDTFVDLYLDGVKLEKGVDYEAESGSTRITIQNQTLNSTLNGKHTLGIEFREGENLKRAAQNFVNNSPNHSSGGSTESGNNSGNSTGNDSTVIDSNLNNRYVAEETSVIEWDNVTSLLEKGVAQTVFDTASNIMNINVYTNGTVKIGSSVLQNIQGKNSTVAFHAGNGIALSISGQNLNGLNLTSDFNLDLTVDSNTKNIPNNLVATRTAGTLKEIQFSIKDTGKYPAIVNVHIAVGKEYVGKNANLYRYNATTGRLEYGGNFVVTKEGQAMFPLRKGGFFLFTVTNQIIEERFVISSRQYIVKKGDTMSLIARKNNMSLAELLQKNAQILKPHFIKPGQIINL